MKAHRSIQSAAVIDAADCVVAEAFYALSAIFTTVSVNAMSR
jgi:hypothetical protein